MGNNSSINKINKKNEEIRFLLVSHREKYQNYIFLPRYGLDFYIEELKKNKNKEIIQEILSNLERWKSDTEFAFNMRYALGILNNKDEKVYQSFLKDLDNLKEKILLSIPLTQLQIGREIHSLSSPQ